jgi:hypothetical protein
MTRRLPATPPGPPLPPPSFVDDAPDPLEPHPLSEEWADDPLDPELLDTDAWPDDLDEPTVPDDLLERELEELPPLDDVGDDGVEEDFELPAEDPPLEDDLTDLDAPDDSSQDILPWSLVVTLDGRPVSATVDPSLERTLWLRTAVDLPSGGPTTREVRLLIAGHTLLLEVDCATAPQEGLRLGLDVLAGRFLLRP